MIELGGLVLKADLVELLNDDRATILGALLDAAAQLQGMGDADPAHLRARWRRAGMRAFEADKEAVLPAMSKREEGQPEQEQA